MHSRKRSTLSNLNAKDATRTTITCRGIRLAWPPCPSTDILEIRTIDGHPALEIYHGLQLLLAKLESGLPILCRIAGKRLTSRVIGIADSTAWLKHSQEKPLPRRIAPGITL